MRWKIQKSGSNNLDRSGDHYVLYRNRKETGAGKESERESISRLFPIRSCMLRTRNQGSIPHPLPVDMADPDVCVDRGAVQPDVVDLHQPFKRGAKFLSELFTNNTQFIKIRGIGGSGECRIESK